MYYYICSSNAFWENQVEYQVTPNELAGIQQLLQETLFDAIHKT